jgi:hypothetical protein
VFTLEIGLGVTAVELGSSESAMISAVGDYRIAQWMILHDLTAPGVPLSVVNI